MRWFVRGDVDGFFGLALDNLIQLLLINGLCTGVLGFAPELVEGRILPGAAVSLLVGNLFYAWQAKRLAAQTGRTDVCALPYGINTVSLIAHVFLVMAPAKEAAETLLKEDPTLAIDPARVAWQAGLVACLGSGLIELVGSLFVDWLRRFTPRAALLSTLAGIAIGFISMSFFFRTFAHPIVGLATLGLILLTYFGRVRFRGGLPGGLIAVAVGTALSWATGVAKGAPPTEGIGLHLPVLVVGDLGAALSARHALNFLSVIVPMGLFNLLGSLQNIESAEAAGDRYPTAPSLAVNGLGSVAACLFGSCFPTTIYIGHPGWKGMGARAGYSVLNAVVLTAVCLFGLLRLIAWAVPVDAGMAIVLWIGIVITAQAFQATPREHAPAVVVGILPGLAAWGLLMAKQALQVGGQLGGPALSPEMVPLFNGLDNWIDGGFAVNEGFIFTSMILAAATVAVIERQFIRAGLWCFAAAALSALGFMHSYRFEKGDTVLALLHPAWEWTIGYAIMGLAFVGAKWLTRPSEAAH
jgi:adenine/guanine/hypoxanthine permease